MALLHMQLPVRARPLVQLATAQRSMQPIRASPVSASRQRSAEYESGVLMRWTGRSSNYGFIQPDDGGEELFLNKTNLLFGIGSVREGNKVLFIPQWDDRHGNYE